VINRINVTFYEHVIKALQRAYPKHYFAEYGDLRGRENHYSWHILPVHNQTSLIRGLPDWCFSVICKKNDHSEHSLVIFPATNEEYSASRGSGASLNERRLRVSGNNDLSLALISTNILQNISESATANENLALYRKLDEATFGIRSGHCFPQQIVWVAAGKLDATLMTHTDPLETTAALLIAREAGVLTGDFAGRPVTDRSDSIICSNPKILRAISQKIHRAEQQP
jgi:myo-inositol-1(or 4)-monophosphatase